MSNIPAPIAVTIAGSDSSGGAGIQADLKTFSALNTYGASVITALTAQNTRGVSGIHPVPADFITAQIQAVFSDLAVNAVKIGMVPTTDIATTIADGLAGYEGLHIVFDPVMVATSGDVLIEQADVAGIVSTLFPIADVITPNLQEAAFLLNCAVASDEAAMVRQGNDILKLGAKAVLMKGGHQSGKEAIDILVSHDHSRRFSSMRVETKNTHGTGCTLSSAIAAGLAHGYSLRDAVARAKSYLAHAIASADRLKIGEGAGPVHHFYNWWD